MEPKVSYRSSKDSLQAFEGLIKEIIETKAVRSVCDIGGGANPLLKAEYVKDRALDYSILDISKTELDKAPAEFSKVIADIASSNISIARRFDFMFSRMLAEHIGNAKQFHTNVWNLLNPGGLAMHYFPTLYALPFLVNLVLPERVGEAILNKLAPRDRYRCPKFAAYYDWCRGPTDKQIRRLGELRYQIVEYRGLFGHEGYYSALRPMKYIHQLLSERLLRNPNPHLTSYAWVLLKKP